MSLTNLEHAPTLHGAGCVRGKGKGYRHTGEYGSTGAYMLEDEEGCLKEIRREVLR